VVTYSEGSITHIPAIRRYVLALIIITFITVFWTVPEHQKIACTIKNLNICKHLC